MNIFQKIKQWWDEEDCKCVQEFKRYELNVTFTNGEVKTYTSNRYYNILCSYSKYRSYDLENGIELGGRIYPQHMIASMEDRVIDTQLVVPVGKISYGVWGVTEEDIKNNQEDYKILIEKYKKVKKC